MSHAMPLQNRVTPFGEIVAVSPRGLLMGNRGGRLHDPPTKTLGRRRWISRQWISCRVAFGGRRREVMGRGYTELFFLDEVTALAAGHRPCHLCRRPEAHAFGEAWRIARGLDRPPRASEIDRVLHAERTPSGMRPDIRQPFADLPDGTMVALPSVGTGPPAWQSWAVRGGAIHRWDHAGYVEHRPRPQHGLACPLTPPSLIEVLRAGYAPLWHPSVAT
jgi:hypothetical protein